MTAYDFVQITLYVAGGPIKGRTRLQKTVYFLGLLTDRLETLGYQAHHYGPYSADVAEAVSTLEGIGFASSTIASVGSYDPQGFEIRRTDYSLTDEGRRAAERKAKADSQLYEVLKDGFARFQQAGELDYVRLSIAAKANFLLRQKKSLTSERELQILARTFGWTVSEQQIDEGLAYLRKLNIAQL